MEINDLKILVAEDNQLNIFLMKKLLSKWNINADFTENGLATFEAFERNDYDLILMDLQMPIMDGYATTRLIRAYQDGYKASIKIIALSASMPFEIRNKILEAGMDDYISKPFNAEELKNKFEELALARLNKCDH